MHNFITMAERDFKKAEINYEQGKRRSGITDVELGNLVQKMEYARAVHTLIAKNYEGR